MDEASERPMAPQTAARGGAARWPAVAGLLLAVAAGAGVAWLWVGQQESQRVLAELGEVVARLPAPAPDRSAGLQQQLEAARATVAALEARVAALEGAQRTLQDTLAGHEGADRRLAEAQYLQRLASQSLLMGREVRGAIALLEASDEILRERDDPALHQARALLAHDLAALRGVAAFDAEGAWLRLAALAAAVPGLVLAERHVPALQAGIAEAPRPATWGARALALIERFVVIRHDAPAPRPLPALVDEQMLRMGVRLALEQAKLAVLAAEQQPYAGALEDAGALVRAHFDPAAAPNRAFLEELARLAGEQVAPPLPDLSGSLHALREAAQPRPAAD